MMTARQRRISSCTKRRNENRDESETVAILIYIFAVIVVVIFIVVVVILKGAFVGRESMGKEVEEIPNCL